MNSSQPQHNILVSSYLMDANQTQTDINSEHSPSQETHSQKEAVATPPFYDTYASFDASSSSLNTLSVSSKSETAQTQMSETNNDSKQCESESHSTTEIEGEIEGEEHDDLLILMDWDDTLYPTTMMNNVLQSRDGNDLALVPDEEIGIFHALANHTLELLTDLIAKYGANNVHIVSNSLQGWIRESLSYGACISTVYKDIEQLLIDNDITICSAQSMFASKTNQNPTSWKAMCFEQILNGKKTKASYAHILSIGDQWTDHYAVKQSINTLKQSACYKTAPIHHILKLKISPNLHDMMNEILYIKTCFEEIFNVISCKKTAFYANPQSVRPVVIDYHHEEMKYYNMNCSNINVNLNVNVNVNVNVVNK